MADLTIGAVAKRAGLATSAIRYYEAEGLLPKALRSGNRRVYSESIFERLALIELAQSAGFTIREIKQLLAGFRSSTPPSQRWQRLTKAKVSELEARIEDAERMLGVLRTVRRCACPTLDDCGRALVRERDARSG